MSQIDNTIIGTSGNDVLNGTALNDLMDGGLGDDTLYGGAGDDVFIDDDPAGQDVFWGGAGSDTYKFAFGTLVLPGLPDHSRISGLNEEPGNSGTDTFVFMDANFSDLVFTSGYTGAGYNNYQPGNLYIRHIATNQVLGVGWQFNTMDLSNTGGIENFVFADGTTMNRAQLLSVISGGTFVPGKNVTGTAGNDVLTGSAGDDTIDGGDGDDTLHCSGGADIFIGGPGKDTVVYTGSPGGVTINMITGTGTGADAQGDTFSGIEVIVGSNYADTLIASGAVTLEGGAGDDTYVISGPDVIVVEQSGSGTDTVQVSTGSYTLTDGVENLVYTGTGNFTGTGNALDNTITGGAGNDTLNAGAGDNIVDGGAGDDTLLNCGCGGSNIFYGGDGKDTVSYINLGNGVTVNLITGTANTGATKGDTLHSIEVVVGSNHADTLIAAASATLEGGAGDDTYVISGPGVVVVEQPGGGIDTVKVTDGLGSYTLGDNVENLVHEGTGDFTGTGNGLDNTMTGGKGVDSLNGGAGNDTYQIAFNSEPVIGAPNLAHIDSVNDLAGEGTEDELVLTNANLTDLEFTKGYDGAGLENLYIRDTRTNQVMVVSGQFSSIDPTGTAGIETFTFADGTSITRGDVLGMVDGKTITGTPGNDTLTGGWGNDTLIGGDGNDVLTGGYGADVLNGGNGTDTANYGGSSSGVTIDFGTGKGTGGEAQGDTLSSIEIVIGSSHGDTLNSAASNAPVTLIGGAGNDTYGINGTNVTVVEQPGGGIDTAVVTGITSYTMADGLENLVHIGCVGGFTAYGNALDNVMQGSECNDTLYGGDGNDSLDGGAGDDWLDGGNGKDTLYGGLGNDTLQAGAGDDILIYDNKGRDSLWGEGGNDTYQFAFGSDVVAPNLPPSAMINIVDQEGQGSLDELVFTDANRADLEFMQGYQGDRFAHLYVRHIATNEVIEVAYQFSGAASTTTAGIDTFRFADGTSMTRGELAEMLHIGFTFTGTPGNDTINGGSGNDTINGLDGNDTLNGFAGNDTIYGGDGDDSLDGGDGNDWLDGGNGKDTLYGGLGNDTLQAGAGDDILIYDNKGRDSLWGEGGNDTYQFAFGSDVVAPNLPPSAMINIVDQEGQGSLDELVFTDANRADLEFMQGYQGDRFAHLYVRHIATNEVIEVAYQFSGAASTTTAGIDTFRFADGTSMTRGELAEMLHIGFTFTGTPGNDTINGGSGNDTINGLDSNDTLNGFAGNDTIYGGDGNDTLDGGVGDDWLDGGNGTDTLQGGLGNDTLQAAAGDDILIHDGNGRDSLWGQAGNDTYQFAFGSDVVAPNLPPSAMTNIVDQEGQGEDTLVFTDANRADVEFMQGYEGDRFAHLYVRHIATNKVIEVAYQFSSASPSTTAGIETFVFADQTLTRWDVLDLV